MAKTAKSRSRAILESKREDIVNALMHAKPHPLYPGLEFAKLPKAQYKFVHLINQMYYRIYAKDKFVSYVKGFIHPTQVITLSEFDANFNTRRLANEDIKATIGKLLLEGYVWEGNGLTFAEAESLKNYKDMVSNRQTVNFAKADEKYQVFENLIKTVV